MWFLILIIKTQKLSYKYNIIKRSIITFKTKNVKKINY